jgi:hypothetical protein
MHITFQALAIEPFYMREPNPTEPASKLTLYYHMPSIQCCAVRVQSITESKKEKEEGEIKQQSAIYPYIYVLKSSEARRQII